MNRLHLSFWLLLLFLGSTNALFAQGPVLDWAISAGGVGFDIGRAVALDAQGNAYAAGFFQATADFDPGAGTLALTSAGDNDIFVQKLGPSGNLIWARSMGGSMVDEAKGVAVDAAGNVYVTGRFSGTVDFDPGVGVASATAVGQTDSYVLKLDASGNFVWFRQMGAAGADEGTALVADASGVYTIGYFQGTMDLDPGAGTNAVTSVSGTLDAWVQHLDAAGAHVWGWRLGSDGLDYGFGITRGANGSVYVTGCFQGTADFNPGVGTANLTANVGATSAYVLAVDGSGNYQWASQIGVDNFCIGYALATSNSGALFVTGGYNGTNMDFDHGTGSDLHTSSASYDVFVKKFDLNGGFQGAWTFGDLGDDYGYAIDVTADDAVYFTGGYGATVDFDPSPTGTYSITSFNNTFDMFIERMDTAGSFVWARSIGGGDIEYGFGLAADATGHVLTTGCFGQQVDFDTESGVYNLSTNGAADIFVHKLKQCLPSSDTVTLSGCDSLDVNGQTFTTSGTYNQTLTNLSGCDSTLTLWLTIGQTSYATLMDTACFSYSLNGFDYDSSGTYIQQLTNVAGCDSILTLELVVDTLHYQFGWDFVSLYFYNAPGATFEWLDCSQDTIIAGNTDSTFHPPYQSFYAGIISQDGCSDTTTCYQLFVGVKDPQLTYPVHLFPNPSQGAFVLDLGGMPGPIQLEIHNTLGELIYQAPYQQSEQLRIDGPNGLYFVSVRNEEGSQSLKMLKE